MKKVLITFLIIAIPLGIGGGLLFDNLQKKKSEEVQESKPSITKKLPSEKTKEYKDESGFSFEHPDDIIASASSTLDSSTYTDIQLISKMATGSINIKVFDTKLKKIDMWLKENKASESGIVKDVNLGSLSAKEITKKDKSVKTAVIDQSILFEVSVLPEKEVDYWNQVYKKILESFSFVNPQASQSTGNQSGGESDVIYEGEEIVE